MARRASIGRLTAGTLLVTLLAAALGACAGARATAPESPPKPPMPGSDRDAHGCIPSAGYRWCARTQRCERPWELAREHGFENRAEAFDAFCSAQARRDRQGGPPTGR
jgi:hypothetical protein